MHVPVSRLAGQTRFCVGVRHCKACLGCGLKKRKMEETKNLVRGICWALGTKSHKITAH